MGMFFFKGYDEGVWRDFVITDGVVFNEMKGFGLAEYVAFFF